MKDGIDYLRDEMNAYAKGMKLPEISEFYRGWRAALEAAHARAEAKGGEERARYWANPPSHKPRLYWACRGEVVSEYVYQNGDTAPSSLKPKDWTDGHVFAGWTPCTTEAEARKVAGFTEEKE